MNNNLIFQVEDKPKKGQLFIFALQQLLSIIAGTIAVPTLIKLPEMMPAAILGCGLGTLAYIFITKKKSPVILSSNFAFIGALTMAYQGYGFLGICLGGLFVGSVYITLSLIVKKIGTKWIDKIFPPIIIGPVVALIGLTLAGNAMSDLVTANGYFIGESHPYNLLALLCGLLTFFTIVICGMQNHNRFLNLTPFLIGIGVGYLAALLISIIGYASGNSYFKIIDFAPLIDNFSEIKVASFIDYPRFGLFKGIEEIATDSVKLNMIGVLEIFVAFVPVALVSFSEHIADHKNLSSVIGRDLLGEEPGLHRTLLGDGVGSIVGTMFGVCPETTYSQTIGCVAMTKNASISTTILTCVMCICLSFLTPVIALLKTIPTCVMGGICLALYGFIATSGLKMLNGLEISSGKNLYTLAAILVAGIGGLTLQIPYQFGVFEGTDIVNVVRFISISSIAIALILGIVTYSICNAIEKHNKKEDDLDE